MEIKFENKVLSSYREVFHQLKRIQESAESVVPDTNDDIGRIASVRTSVLLKSKDISGRGVTVTGEADAVLLYITENESSVSFVHVTKAFSMEYEIGDMESDTTAQIHLFIANAEARVLNPRKVSVTFEIAGELSCYMPESVDVDVSLPEDICQGIHVKYESYNAVLPNAVCEKSFALNEQYSFPAGKAEPSKLVFENADFCIDETQHIGSKIIIKGSVNLDVCYLSQELNYPLRTRFTSPFSQIIDTGEESMDNCTAVVALTSAYYELIDTISGEKALDTELHAVVQIVSRSKTSIKYISDAYCNTMPAACTVKNSQLALVSDMLKEVLNKDEQISIAEDCEDVLSVFASINHASAVQGKFSASLNIDIIYKNTNGNLASARRIIAMEKSCTETNVRLLNASIADINIKPQGSSLDARISLELCYQSISQKELSRVTELELDEEKYYDLSKLPTVSLVRAEGEDMWELAKTYHSSPESIVSSNPNDSPDKSTLYLIPKEI